MLIKYPWVVINLLVPLLLHLLGSLLLVCACVCGYNLEKFVMGSECIFVVVVDDDLGY